MVIRAPGDLLGCRRGFGGALVGARSAGAAGSAAKSRPRIKIRDATAATAAPMSRIAFRPSAKPAWVAAAACLAATVRPDCAPLAFGPPIEAAIACAASGHRTIFGCQHNT